MFHLRKSAGRTTIANVMSIEFNGITSDMSKDVITSTREFIASCSLDSKEQYLDWVQNYKRINAILTDVSKRLKTLRRPVYAVGSSTYKSNVTAYNFRHPGVEKSINSHLYDFEVARGALLRAIGLALTELYNARYNYKLASSVVAAENRFHEGVADEAEAFAA
jgi:hypothetical protein